MGLTFLFQYVVNPVFGAWTKVIPTNCPRTGQNGQNRVQIRWTDVRTSEAASEPSGFETGRRSSSPLFDSVYAGFRFRGHQGKDRSVPETVRPCHARSEGSMFSYRITAPQDWTSWNCLHHAIRIFGNPLTAPRRPSTLDRERIACSEAPHIALERLGAGVNQLRRQPGNRPVASFEREIYRCR